MTKNKLFLNLTASMQQALVAAQHLIWTQYRVWTLFVGMDEPKQVGSQERQITVYLMTKDEAAEDVEVFVHEVKSDSGWRVIQSIVVKKGDWAMSNQKFNSTLIVYEDAKARERYAAKNEALVARLNSGEKFGFITDRYGQLSGSDDPIDPFYSFIVMPDGKMPLPVFFEAANIDMLKAFGTYKTREVTEGDRTFEVVEWHEATEAEIDAYLRQTFGSQYLIAVCETIEVEILATLIDQGYASYQHTDYKIGYHEKVINWVLEDASKLGLSVSTISAETNRTLSDEPYSSYEVVFYDTSRYEENAVRYGPEALVQEADLQKNGFFVVTADRVQPEGRVYFLRALGNQS